MTELKELEKARVSGLFQEKDSFTKQGSAGLAREIT